MLRLNWIRILGLPLGVLVVDRATKMYALVALDPFLNTTLSFIPQKIGIPSIFFACILVIFGIFVRIHIKNSSASVKIAAAVLFCSGLSNFFDRIMYGGVIDWIPITPLLSINIADVAIPLSAAYLIRHYLRAAC